MTGPGLAMSRSVGDSLAHTLGCSSDAEISKYLIHPRDKAIILGTDGIFEYMSMQEIGDIVYPYYQRRISRANNKNTSKDQVECEEASEAIIEVARERWVA